MLRDFFFILNPCGGQLSAPFSCVLVNHYISGAQILQFRMYVSSQHLTNTIELTRRNYYWTVRPKMSDSQTILASVNIGCSIHLLLFLQTKELCFGQRSGM